VEVRYPAIEPYETGMLDVGDGNLVYWESTLPVEMIDLELIPAGVPT
jgi:hypothetical protein